MAPHARLGGSAPVMHSRPRRLWHSRAMIQRAVRYATCLVAISGSVGACGPKTQDTATANPDASNSSDATTAGAQQVGSKTNESSASEDQGGAENSESTASQAGPPAEIELVVAASPKQALCGEPSTEDGGFMEIELDHAQLLTAAEFAARKLGWVGLVELQCALSQLASGINYRIGLAHEGPEGIEQSSLVVHVNAQAEMTVVYPN